MVEAVEKIRSSFPDTPIYALCRDMKCAGEIKGKGAYVAVSSAQGGVALGDMLLRGLGTTDADLQFLEMEMMAAVKETVRSASTRTPSVSDIELFVYSQAQVCIPAVNAVSHQHKMGKLRFVWMYVVAA